MINPYKYVSDFEQAIADFSGSKYAVAVESGSAALFLSLLYRKHQGHSLQNIICPSRTYPSAACSIINAGGTIQFSDFNWHGIYELHPVGIIDGALRFKRDMYVTETLHCLSFHAKKHLPISRGGMILTDDEDAYKWLKLARFDGREEEPLEEMKEPTVIGWNMYLTPEQAARGLMLFQTIKNKDLHDLDANKQGYPDLSKFKIYQ